jgi:hypothetical protein
MHQAEQGICRGARKGRVGPEGEQGACYTEDEAGGYFRVVIPGTRTRQCKLPFWEAPAKSSGQNVRQL